MWCHPNEHQKKRYDTQNHDIAFHEPFFAGANISYLLPHNPAPAKRKRNNLGRYPPNYGPSHNRDEQQAIVDG